MEFIYDHDKEIAQFVNSLTPPGGGTFGRYKTIGVIDRDGRLIAGVVYFNYDPNADVIEMGIAATHWHWATRASYRRIFEYPFIECGCQMVFGRVRADNEHVLGLLAKLNFNLTFVPRMYGRDEDGVLCTLTDDDWLDNRLSRRLYRGALKKEAA